MIIIAIIINIITNVIVIVVIIIITTSIVGTYRKMWDIVVKKLETADRSMPLIIVGDVDDDDVDDKDDKDDDNATWHKEPPSGGE